MKKWLLEIKNLISLLMIVSILSSVVVMGACTTDQYIDSANIYMTFEDDFDELKYVADYLLSLDFHMIVIRNNYSPMTIDYGEKMYIEDETVKETLGVLFKKGYLSISSLDNTICFERWKKRYSYEYRSGFAFSCNETGNIDIQYIINQEELSISNWYYYEEDYNEWRVRNSK